MPTLKKYINLKLIFRKNKNYHKKKTADYTLWHSYYLKHLSSASLMSLHSGFSSRSILNLFCSDTLVILFCFSKSLWLQNLQDKIPHTRQFSFSIFYFLYQYNFFLDAQNLSFVCDCNHYILYESPVNCRSGKVEGNIMHSHCCYCHFPVLEFM